ncbi:MAG: molybdopterin-dependent oxidoreductase [Dehalococcoidia bacterium]|jgi:molybdopterin-containing oxidoreductase family molybdopterin binding subunit|nr:molybdopterin-dependent oxidoreductase [Dehalococcoidia bacterium]
MVKTTTEIWEDEWIPSACSICYNQCGIKVHRVNGVVVKIEGNPDSALGMGRLCPRGLAGIQMLYDPHRVNHPLRRTNPEKGIGVDPQWERISWDEALDIITERLSKIRQDNPHKLLFSGCVPSIAPLFVGLGVWRAAYGTANAFLSDGHQCGNAEHLLAGTLHAATTTNPDLAYCNYLLIFGCHVGFSGYYAYTTMAQRMAEARSRGMRVVVVDPMMNTAAEKADEWLPLLPGSDGALALAMLNLLLNEYGIYDAPYLREHTNATYLIGEDGLYVRDGASGKPIVWDAVSSMPRVFDDPLLKEPALEGSHKVGGQWVRTAFDMLRDSVREWTPEAAAAVTTLPADTIRRIAREFGEAARIGSTIVIDGKELPYRPAAVIYFKGAHGHDNAWGTSLAIELLAEVVGASNVPGSLMGCNPVNFGHPDTGMPHYQPTVDKDGMLVPGLWFGMSQPGTTPPPFPPRDPRKPRFLNLIDLVPWPISTFLPVITNTQPESFGIDYKAEALVNYGSNLVMSLGNPETTVNAFKDLFTVCINLWVDETAEALADIVLPDTCYLERLDPVPVWYHHHHPVGMGDWTCQIRQPIVPPAHERRHFSEVLLDLANRLDFLPDFQVMLNLFYGLKPPYALDPEAEYTWEEICDRIYKGWFGEKRGLEWFKEHGVLNWKKQVEEAYWKPFTHARGPIYFEWIEEKGRKIKKIVDELGLEDWDMSTFKALPHWRPCQALQPREGYDLQAIYYRVPFHTFSMTYENPWLDEVSRLTEPYSYFISINTETARRKGIKDGDEVWVESADAGRVRGQVKVVEGVHPQVVGIAHNGGHWARGMPFAKGKGVFFNALLALDLKHTDMVSFTMDCDARVKVYKT